MPNPGRYQCGTGDLAGAVLQLDRELLVHTDRQTAHRAGVDVQRQGRSHVQRLTGPQPQRSRSTARF
ncbi:hypothetical protein NCG97_21790 [Streptomyces lydicamycinicus]|uniref:hypothetical protein n=1 Tax=Streptomyces lydicamycinicus TaxID=1546107 RepID=UPI00203658C7|nr:hypothetical protein [Streptomyces lydicamycinicus]USA02701.1 hypothetical protein NCG97_21790 [Streptomyces lydicamycinicus]